MPAAGVLCLWQQSMVTQGLGFPLSTAHSSSAPLRMRQLQKHVCFPEPRALSWAEGSVLPPASPKPCHGRPDGSRVVAQPRRRSWLGPEGESGGLTDSHPKRDSSTRTTPPSNSAAELPFRNGSKPLETVSVFNLYLLWREQLP